ncbi:MAG: hypothetical protein IPM86_14225 [Saprospiraceae bacterium]|nr:hypothetical protein [Saprospiraceae bacterium]
MFKKCCPKDFFAFAIPANVAFYRKKDENQGVFRNIPSLCSIKSAPMRISLSWLKELLPINDSAEFIADRLTGLGLEVEGMEQLDAVKGGLQGIVVGRVLECVKHPQADRLSLTKVDVGAAESLSIVCGAPNVAAGQLVLVATVGTTLYPSLASLSKSVKPKCAVKFLRE